MTIQLSATATNYAGHRSRLQTERDQLTGLLRALAADLDDLDRRLSDTSWSRRGEEASPQSAVLLAQRERMNTRLHGLARHLSYLDNTLSGSDAQSPWAPGHVGTCPDCGYPSLGSGLCAPCRMYQDR